MARGKKTSSEKVAKIVSEKIKKPDSSLKDLSKKTGVNKQTVSDILKKQGQEVLTSSDYTQQLVDENIKIIQKGKKIIFEQLEKINKKGGVKILSVSDIKSISSTVEEAFKQNQLLTGSNTENSEIKIKIIE